MLHRAEHGGDAAGGIREREEVREVESADQRKVGLFQTRALRVSVHRLRAESMPGILADSRVAVPETAAPVGVAAAATGASRGKVAAMRRDA
jgi:hypothetical protein